MRNNKGRHSTSTSGFCHVFICAARAPPPHTHTFSPLLESYFHKGSWIPFSSNLPHASSTYSMRATVWHRDERGRARGMWTRMPTWTLGTLQGLWNHSSVKCMWGKAWILTASTPEALSPGCISAVFSGPFHSRHFWWNSNALEGTVNLSAIMDPVKDDAVSQKMCQFPRTTLRKLCKLDILSNAHFKHAFLNEFCDTEISGKVCS